MSTDHRPLKEIAACDLFDGRLEEFGVRIHVKQDEKTGEEVRMLTDGRNYLWVYVDDDGFVSFTRYMPNGNPGKILSAVDEAFETYIASEYEPQYWDFDTQEEWDACMERMSREYEENFHVELLKYCRGEPNDIEPGTSGMLDAEIAKKLSEKDPSLLLPENKDRLRSQIEFLRPRP